MTDGGAIAIDRFRYQDWCAIYFALESYIQSPTIFEQLYCEQDKLDFEVWNCKDFHGYQVKGIQGSLTAKEVNKIFKYYIEKASNLSKSNKAFWFVFNQEPKHSLNYLLLELSGNSGVKSYKKRTEKYIEDALKNLDVTNFKIGYHCYNSKMIEDLVFSISCEVLKRELEDTHDIPMNIVSNFIAVLREKIDIASSEEDSLKRIYTFNDINTLIRTFLSGIKLVELEQEGLRKKVVTGKPVKQTIQSFGVPKERSLISAELEGGEIK